MMIVRAADGDRLGNTEISESGRSVERRCGDNLLRGPTEVRGEANDFKPFDSGVIAIYKECTQSKGISKLWAPFKIAIRTEKFLAPQGISNPFRRLSGRPFFEGP
jgi:hypothetical protein